MSTIEDRVNEILACADDPEAAHTMEDDLIWSIAIACAPQEDVAQLSRLRAADFPRWCA